MSEENTIVYSYNKDTKIYTISSKEMQKINRKLKERFTLKQENKQLQNNWNELKKWLEDDFYMSYYEEDLSSGWVVEIIKKKMQELEGNNE